VAPTPVVKGTALARTGVETNRSVLLAGILLLLGGLCSIGGAQLPALFRRR